MVNFLEAPSESRAGETSVPLNFGNVADDHIADGLVQVPGLPLGAESNAGYEQ